MKWFVGMFCRFSVKCFKGSVDWVNFVSDMILSRLVFVDGVSLVLVLSGSMGGVFY